ncbi:TetR/AcrR family transcriptional regulator, partial [bacterium]|nr:TetR/AcrR family transcriptional regulator [bacterium]
MTTEISPSERRYQRTRQSILEAAQAILSEQGIEALSMRALAEKADYSPAALYKY